MWSGGEARMARPWRCDLWPDSRIMSLPGARGPPDCDEFWLLSPFVCCQDPLTWPWSFSFWRFIFFSFDFFFLSFLSAFLPHRNGWKWSFELSSKQACRLLYIFLMGGDVFVTFLGRGGACALWKPVNKKKECVGGFWGRSKDRAFNQPPPYSTVASVDVARQRVDCKGVLQFVE